MPIFHDRLGAELASAERVFRPIGEGAGSSAFENVVVEGAVIPWHQHRHEEVLVCLAGRAECTFAGGSPERYSAGSVVVIPAHTRHTIRALGPGPLRQLSFFAGPAPETEWDTDAGDVIA
jgi:quercetin dioxygenase-like cupin family protein